MSSLLVTGAGGMLGQAVVAEAQRLGYEVTGLTRSELDIVDAATVGTAVARLAPAAIVNCAAWTDVDGAEAHEAEATEVNGTGAGNVARAGAAHGAFVVQVSTDYVFDGSKTTPWAESDPTGPRSAYGRSKLAGEEAVAAATPDHAIVRTAWLFGAGGGNFVDTMLRLGAERDEVTVVTDQVGSPTWAGHLAGALLEIAQRRAPGMHHAAGSGQCSWNELAIETFDRAGVDCRVRPMTSDRLERPAPRPAYSVLGVNRPDTPVLPPWQEGLAAYLAARDRAVAGGTR